MKTLLKTNRALLIGAGIFGIALLGLAFQNKPAAPAIFLIGDSTMAERKEPVEVNPERGWGQALHLYFRDEVAIHNHAVNGRSSKSFIDEGRWDKVMELLKPGDYVLIQFGHNDQKFKDPTRYTNPTSGYYHNLSRFVVDTRSKGAIPILLTSIVRRNFNEFGTLEDTHGIYPLIVRQVANDLDVLLIDHLSKTEKVVLGLGPERSKEIYFWIEPGTYDKLPDGKQDNTHLSEKGAVLYAGMVAGAIRQSDLPLKEFVILK